MSPHPHSPPNQKNLEKILDVKKHDKLATKDAFKEGNWFVKEHGSDSDVLFIGYHLDLLNFAPGDVIPTFKILTSFL